MSQATEIRALFDGPFGPPCTEQELRKAEESLGERFPADLRKLYLAFDGFRGSTQAAFFWSLFGSQGLVELNKFYRSDDLFPQELIRSCLFFGDNGCGPQWAFKSDLPGKIILWDAEWGDDFEIVGDSPLDVWKAEKMMYDSLAD